MSEEAATASIRKAHPPEVVAVNVRDLIMARQPLVDERIVRGQQLQNATVVLQLTRDEQLGLLLHGVTQVLVEVREGIHIGNDARDFSQLQPLIGKIIDQGARAGVAEHPPNLLIQDRRIVEPATDSQLEELVVGDGAPEKK